MKYIFKQIDDISGNNAETTIEFTADYLPTILEHFEMFLRGSGFHPSGTLDFVEEEDTMKTVLNLNLLKKTMKNQEKKNGLSHYKKNLNRL
jgi:hypothetical protein